MRIELVHTAQTKILGRILEPVRMDGHLLIGSELSYRCIGNEYFAWPERVVRNPASALAGMVIHTWRANISGRDRTIELARCEELQFPVIEQRKRYIYLFPTLLDLYPESSTD